MHQLRHTNSIHMTHYDWKKNGDSLRDYVTSQMSEGCRSRMTFGFGFGQHFIVASENRRENIFGNCFSFGHKIQFRFINYFFLFKFPFHRTIIGKNLHYETVEGNQMHWMPKCHRWQSNQLMENQQKKVHRLTSAGTTPTIYSKNWTFVYREFRYKWRQRPRMKFSLGN